MTEMLFLVDIKKLKKGETTTMDDNTVIVEQQENADSDKLDQVADLFEKFIIMIIKIVDMIKSLIANR